MPHPTNLPGLLVGGVPVIGGVGVPLILPKNHGNVFHVDQERGQDDTSRGSHELPLKTLLFCHNTMMVANRNDVAVVHGHSSAATGAQRLAATLTWSKDMCHIIGASVPNRVSQRVSIRQLSTATVFTPFVKVTAQSCIFSDLHVFCGFNNASAQVAWADEGQRNTYIRCHIGGFGHQLAADHVGSRALKLGAGGNGEHYFYGCVFGLDTVDRGAANATLEVVAGAPRITFEDCDFIMRADAASPVHLLVGAGGIDRYLNFRGNCNFINAGTFTGASTITEAMTVNAAAGGVIMLSTDCQLVGGGDWENTQSSRVYVAAALAAATSGRMVASTT